MITRLLEFTASDKYTSQFLSVWGAKRSLHAFLTRRCSKEFLALYLQGSPELVDKVCDPGLRLNWSSEVDLAVRLHKFGLLPEENRVAFVDVVSAYAVSGEDVYALADQAIRSVFTNDEHETLVKRVREELLPALSQVREKVQAGYGEDDPPDEYMAHMLESFETLKATFGDDADALRIIEREVKEANDWISENEHERPEKAPRSLDTAATTDKLHGSRSIFDDIDV
jgi:hypothetical protein